MHRIENGAPFSNDDHFVLHEKMKTNLTIMVLCVLMCGCRSGSQPEVAASPAGSEASPAREQHEVRVVDFADSGHHRLIWNVTFEMRTGKRLVLQTPDSAGFRQFAGLGDLRPIDLDRKTDFSGLLWFRIKTESSKTVGLRRPLPSGRLITWEKVKE